MIGLGSSSQLGIGIAVRLHDQFSAEASRINRSLMDLRKNSNSALTEQARSYRNASAAVAVGATGVAMGMYKMAEAGADFQHRINQVAIVGGKELHRSRQQLEDYANQMSKTFTIAPSEVASALFENAKAGITENIELLTKYQVAVANATDEALEGEAGVASQLVNMMNQFGYGATDKVRVAGKEMYAFQEIANGVTAAANATSASVYNIGETMQYFGNSAHLAGLSVEQTLAMAGKLANAGIKSTSAGTALTRMTQAFVDISGPWASKKKTTMLAQAGIDPRKIMALINSGQSLEAFQQFDELVRARIPQRGTRMSFLSKLFNQRGSRGLENLFGEGQKSLRQILGETQSGVANDVVMKQSLAMQKDLRGDMKFLHNAFLRFENAFSKSIAPTLTVMLTGLTKIINGASAFFSGPVGRVFAGLVAMVTPVIAIMFAFRAAALAATFALRGLGQAGARPGFGSLLRGMMGTIGSEAMGPLPAGLARNSMGKYYVAKGASWTHPTTGKLYKAGSMIPQAAEGIFGAASAAAGGASLAAKAGSFFGKAAPWIARAAGLAGDFLPIVGGILIAVQVLPEILSLFRKQDAEKQKLDPIFMEYYKALDANNLGQSFGDSFYNNNSKAKSTQMGLNQAFTINIDGVNANSSKVNTMVAASEAQNVNSMLNIELPDMAN